jgi:single-strand DNA-binding protein
MNKVILFGRLGADPDTAATQGGTPVAKLSMATNRRVKRNEEWVDETDWHRLVAFGRTAETMGRHLRKGSQLLVEGRLQTRSWEDNEGVKRWMTEVIVDRFEFAGSKGDGGQQGRRGQGGGYGQRGGQDGGPGYYQDQGGLGEIPF